jgi:hypothetical protein
MASSEIWQEEEDEDEDEDDYNEMPLEPISEECNDLVMEVKHQLYNNIIFKPDLKSKDAQNIALVDNYRMHLINLNKLCKIVQIRTLSEEELQKKIMDFPVDVKPKISELLHYISNFFHTNEYVDTIPYPDYFDIHFRIHPFLQTDENQINENQINENQINENQSDKNRSNKNSIQTLTKL